MPQQVALAWSYTHHILETFMCQLACGGRTTTCALQHQSHSVSKPIDLHANMQAELSGRDFGSISKGGTIVPASDLARESALVQVRRHHRSCARPCSENSAGAGAGGTIVSASDLVQDSALVQVIVVARMRTSMSCARKQHASIQTQMLTRSTHC